MTLVERFLAAHPWAEPTMVAEIAKLQEAKGLPFCFECCDWHYPNEEHSSVEGTVPPINI